MALQGRLGLPVRPERRVLTALQDQQVQREIPVRQGQQDPPERPMTAIARMFIPASTSPDAT